MGHVKQYLTSVLSKQIDEKSIVLWYDPEQSYGDFAASLALPDTHIAHFTDSFFALRREIEPFLSSPEALRLLVYVPLDESQTHDALIELKAAGSVMKLPLQAISTLALTPFMGSRSATALGKEVQAGKLNLEELDNLAVGDGITKGVVAVILGSGNAQDIALRFLTGEKYDAPITKKNATAELAMLLNNGFGSDLLPANSPMEIRSGFARHVLATEFLSSMKGSAPDSLSAIKTPKNFAAKEACVTLVNEWRNRQDLRDSYAKHAERVGQQLRLSPEDLSLELISGSQTFREVEKALSRDVTSALLTQPTEELVSLAQERLSSFWAEYLPDLQAQWALTAVAGRLLLEAERVEQEIKFSDGSASSWIRAYTDGDRPWCLLDTYHRHLERRYHSFDFEPSEDQSQLSQLISMARHRYMEVGGKLSDSFLRRLRDGKFRLELLSQTDIYDRRVRPELERKKTAYVWVDAMRYEMGRELAESLTYNFEVKCEPAIAAVPTITEVGMAALLPGQEKALSASPARAGKLALIIDGIAIGDRKERVKFLQSRVDTETVVVKLEDLIPKPKKKVSESILRARLILMTSQEIDELCEGDNVPFARTRMDSILHDLHRSFRVLASLGVERFVVAADHGYIFGEDLDESMKVDPPRGETIDLHRRVWVGRGGQQSDSFLRVKVADFNLGSDLELATPWGFGGFKTPGGAKAFFHGGLSLQELVIPLLTLTPREVEVVGLESKFEWDLIPGSQKISTRFFSVQIKGSAPGFLEPVLPKVRIEVRAGGQVVSTPVSASYGFEEATSDVQLRMSETESRAIEPNTVTLLIKDDSAPGAASVHLLEATSGVELKRLPKIEIAISI
jgi:hypothetical protein